MRTQHTFPPSSIAVALIPFSLACSGTADVTPEQAAAQTEQALSPSTSAVGYQQNTGNRLAEAGPDYTGTTSGVMMAGTSPSIAEMNGSYYVDAYQGKDGFLWINSLRGPVNQWLGMDNTSSPSIAGLTDSGFEAAFQANNNELFVTGEWGYAQRTYLGMTPGTNPSIAAFPNNHYQVAFSANAYTGVNNCMLYIYGSLATFPTWLPMACHTSPSLARQPDGSWQVAYQGPDNYLYVYDPSLGGINQGLGMAPNTSPSMAAVPSGGYEIAFQSNRGYLWVVGALPGTSDTYGMAPNTSPSVTPLPGGGWQAAFQAVTGKLWVVGTKGEFRDMAVMAPNTSPSICPVLAKPGQPTANAYIDANGKLGISVAWPPVGGATKYGVYVTNNTERWYDFPQTTAPNLNYIGSQVRFSQTYSFAVKACFPSGLCSAYSKSTSVTPTSGGGGGTTAGSVGVYYYTALQSNLDCSSLTMTGSLSPGAFASNTSGGALTSSSNCPSIQNPVAMQCCAFYLGAGNLAEGKYTFTTNVCANAQTFYLAKGQNKQFVGEETCPTPIN